MCLIERPLFRTSSLARMTRTRLSGHQPPPLPGLVHYLLIPVLAFAPSFLFFFGFFFLLRPLHLVSLWVATSTQATVNRPMSLLTLLFSNPFFPLLFSFFSPKPRLSIAIFLHRLHRSTWDFDPKNHGSNARSILGSRFHHRSEFHLLV